MDKSPARRYSTQKLNNFGDDAWAVIEEPRGAITVTQSGRLLMRLSKDQAREIAGKLNAELQVRSTVITHPSSYSFA